MLFSGFFGLGCSGEMYKVIGDINWSFLGFFVCFQVVLFIRVEDFINLYGVDMFVMLRMVKLCEMLLYC